MNARPPNILRSLRPSSPARTSRARSASCSSYAMLRPSSGGESAEERWLPREAGDAVDALAANREDHDPVGVERAVAALVGVGREGRLAVGARRDEPDPVEAAAERHGAEEGADPSAALEAHRL